MKFLVSLKDPPLTFLVDSCDDELLKEVPNVKFKQGGMSLIIPTLATSTITHIKEITDEEADRFQESIREANLKRTGKIARVKPQFIIPSNKMNQ